MKTINIMKKILIVLIFISFANCKAQSPIFHRYNDVAVYGDVPNAYYKDIDNLLNQFEGTWLYTNGNSSLKITIVKKTMFFTGKYYEDYLIGDYQYIENGVEKVNTLSNISSNITDFLNHQIHGNSIYPGDFNNPLCEGCLRSERKVARLYMVQPAKDLDATLYLRRAEVNGQPALKFYIMPKRVLLTPGDPRTDFLFMVFGEGYLMKQ